MKVTRTRELHAPVREVWRLMSDPYAIPRWWPLARRVEAVSETGWTVLLGKPGGRALRAGARSP